jgi:hypothetical protein
MELQEHEPENIYSIHFLNSLVDEVKSCYPEYKPISNIPTIIFRIIESLKANPKFLKLGLSLDDTKKKILNVVKKYMVEEKSFDSDEIKSLKFLNGVTKLIDDRKVLLDKSIMLNDDISQK